LLGALVHALQSVSLPSGPPLVALPAAHACCAYSPTAHVLQACTATSVLSSREPAVPHCDVTKVFAGTAEHAQFTLRLPALLHNVLAGASQ
jgi:hypothetical protein